MARFTRIHTLTTRASNNINRDDVGQPKTAMIGGTQRARVSSQCQKRALRFSSPFNGLRDEKLIGTRTKLIGDELVKKMVSGGISEEDAADTAKKIVGKLKKSGEGDSVEMPQVLLLAPSEILAMESAAEKFIKDKEIGDLTILQKEHQAIDIALFGRFVADQPQFTVDAAMSVAQSITVHPAAVESDWFATTDDLRPKEEQGSSYLGVKFFTSGVYYSTYHLDKELLLENLGGNEISAKKAINGLMHGIYNLNPRGSQTNFNSVTTPDYMLVQTGDEVIPDLSPAFHDPFPKGANASPLQWAIDQINKLLDWRATAYEPHSNIENKVMNRMSGSGTFEELLKVAGG